VPKEIGHDIEVGDAERDQEIVKRVGVIVAAWRLGH